MVYANRNSFYGFGNFQHNVLNHELSVNLWLGRCVYCLASNIASFAKKSLNIRLVSSASYTRMFLPLVLYLYSPWSLMFGAIFTTYLLEEGSASNVDCKAVSNTSGL